MCGADAVCFTRVPVKEASVVPTSYFLVTIEAVGLSSSVLTSFLEALFRHCQRIAAYDAPMY